MIKVVCNNCKKEKVVLEARNHTLCEACDNEYNERVDAAKDRLSKTIDRLKVEYSISDNEDKVHHHVFSNDGYIVRANNKAQKIKVCINRDGGYCEEKIIEEMVV